MPDYNELAASLNLLSEDIFHTAQSPNKEWVAAICTGNNCSLLQTNTFNAALRTDQSLYLVSAVEEKDDLSLIQAGMGCLGNVVYCVQAYKESAETYALHNFGTKVMDHRSTQTFTPLLFEIKTENLQVGKINYLRMGELFYAISRKSSFFTEPAVIRELENYSHLVWAQSENFLRECKKKFQQKEFIKTPQEARVVIDTISKNIAYFKSLSYIYFEAVSLSLLLDSTDKHSLNCLKKGEFNHSLYIDLVHELKARFSGGQFASYEFCPNTKELGDTIQAMNVSGMLNVPISETLCHIANCILFYIGNCFETKHAILGNIFYDFCKTPQASSMELSDQLDSIVASALLAYTRQKNYDIVINSTIEKGEIGICINIPTSKLRIAQAAYTPDRLQVVKPKYLYAKIVPIKHFGNYSTGMPL